MTQKEIPSLKAQQDIISVKLLIEKVFDFEEPLRGALLSYFEANGNLEDFDEEHREFAFFLREPAGQLGFEREECFMEVLQNPDLVNGYLPWCGEDEEE